MKKVTDFAYKAGMQLWDVSWFYSLIHLRARKYLRASLSEVCKNSDYPSKVLALSNLAKELLGYPERVSNMLKQGKQPTRLEQKLVEWVEENHAEISAYVVSFREWRKL